MANDLSDWHAIYEVLIRYAEGIDRHDFAAVASCFTLAARAEYAGTAIGPGVEAIIEFLRRALTSEASTHLVGNVRIDIDGDTASAESSVVAYHVEHHRMLIRGLRYVDRLERQGQEWRIADRRHVPVWTTELPDGRALR